MSQVLGQYALKCTHVVLPAAAWGVAVLPHIAQTVDAAWRQGRTIVSLPWVEACARRGAKLPLAIPGFLEMQCAPSPGPGEITPSDV